MSPHHIDSTKMVDYVLGNVSSEEQKEMEHHLRACTLCKNELEHWRQMLERQEEFVPSSSLDEKIRHIHAQKITPPKSNQSKRWMYIVTSIAATVLFMVAFSKMYNSNDPFQYESVNQGHIIAQQDKMLEQKMLLQSATNKHPFVSLTDQAIRGEIWLNEETNEIIFLADGFIPLTTEDYQLWVVHADDDWNGQLLHLREGSAQVYYKAPDITLLKYLKVSVEPKGGSLTPTGPEILYVDLKAE